jgi:hypothetical protein
LGLIPFISLSSLSDMLRYKLKREVWLKTSQVVSPDLANECSHAQCINVGTWKTPFLD